jgi:UDP:flavonoid glycosyltransferase YjiC (YdhE family)
MNRVLFFPSFRGGGFGHIGRCLALAQELRQRGWQTAFVLDGQHAAHVEATGQSILRPRHPLSATIIKRLIKLLRKSNPPPAYTLFSDMNFQIARDGFYSAQIVRQRVEQELELVRRFKPDLLIGDTWPLTSIVGRRVGLPVVQIIKSVVHPACPRLIWWDEPPPGLTSPDVRPVFNPPLAEWGLPPIERAEDLLSGDLLLVPSIPELDPLPEGIPATHYVGPLTQTDPRSVEPPDWFDELHPERPLVYVTIGGGADPVGGARLFQVLYEALGDLPLQVLASTSAKLKPTDLPSPPANFILKSWVPGLATIARSDVVVFHGGYGTMMETIHCGVPSVIVPFHSEQEANGRRLETNGAGIVIPHSQGPYQPAWFQWPGGRFSVLVAPQPTLNPRQLRRAIDRILSQDQFRLATTQLRAQLANYGGPPLAADLINTLIHDSPTRQL